MTTFLRRFPILLAALFLGASVRAEPPLRIATVDMQVLFKDYHRTNEAQRELNIERARIQENNQTRLDAITNIEGELKVMRAQLDDPALSDRRKQELFKEFQIKSQDGLALNRERKEFLQRRNTAINEKMMLRMKDILEEIRKIVADHAREANYDYVFDRAGLSTNQVPVLLYSKDVTDLTPNILKELNKDGPGLSKPTGATNTANP